MNSSITFWGEVKDLFLTIKMDCAKNKGMWMAYTFLFIGLVLAITICVLLFQASFMLLNALHDASSTVFVDNPFPVVVWVAILFATREIIKVVHVAYIDVRGVIRKGNR